ncbi:hypothetical protein [Streptomyces flaveolus]|uniref:hypothetical protein n=1 Tax=Streptomyces flaveolus TaxID=67297 RepID=UPI0036F8EDA6
MSHPSSAPARPVLDTADSAVALVTTVRCDGPRWQRAVAETLTRETRERDDWSDGLISLTVYVDGQEETVLVYTQWATRRRLTEALEGPESAAWRGDVDAVEGALEAQAIPFRHYRTVRGSAVSEPVPLPESFPVAFFDTADEDAARAWLDGLLASEERTEGEDRAYPGAVAAHLSISLDGTKVLSFSEWLSEEQAAAHIAAVWEPVLKELGGTGKLYRHFSTVFARDTGTRPR